MRLEEKETTGGITREEIRRVAGQIRVGDKIEWKVITYTYSITYAELAVESRAENARVMEMLRASKRVKN